MIGIVLAALGVLAFCGFTVWYAPEGTRIPMVIAYLIVGVAAFFTGRWAVRG